MTTVAIILNILLIISFTRLLLSVTYLGNEGEKTGG